MKRSFTTILIAILVLFEGCSFDPPEVDDILSKYVRAVRDIDSSTTYGTNSFTDNGDDTVTDQNTGLMWAKYDSGYYLDSSEGIDYESGADGALGLSWEAALTYAEDATLAGYSDWRVPNIKELQSIIDYDYAPDAEDSSYDGPAIDPDFFESTGITNEAGDSDYPYYWSSTSALWTSGGEYYYAWYAAAGKAVDGDGEDFHGAGAIRFDVKDPTSDVAAEDAERYYNYVRLVRDVDDTSSITISYSLTRTGQTDLYDETGAALSRESSSSDYSTDCYGQDGDYLSGSEMSYTDNGDGTITDNVTGLMWQQTPDSSKRSWSDAIEYCEDLELADYDDWRMPTLKELFSMSDFSVGWPYLNQDYFDLAEDEVSKNEQYWSSNDYAGYTVEGGYNAAFGVNHGTGHIKAYASGD